MELNVPLLDRGFHHHSRHHHPHHCRRHHHCRDHHRIYSQDCYHNFFHTPKRSKKFQIRKIICTLLLIWNFLIYLWYHVVDLMFCCMAWGIRPGVKLTCVKLTLSHHRLLHNRHALSKLLFRQNSKTFFASSICFLVTVRVSGPQIWSWPKEMLKVSNFQKVKIWEW